MRKVLLDLNVFFPAVALSYALVGTGLTLPILSMATSAGRAAGLNVQGIGYEHGMSGAVAFIVLSLAVAWWWVGLSPRRVALRRERRFARGHLLVLGTTLAAAACVVVPWFMAKATGRDGFLAFYFTAVLVVPVLLGLWGVGVFMVWSARETAADLASLDYRWRAKNVEKSGPH